MLSDLMRAGDLSDPRAQRTRTALLAAFERQLTTSGELPSVASLTREADVSRAAFYRHFASIDDVGLAILRGALERLGDWDVALRGAADVADADVTRITYRALLEHVAGHRPLYAALLRVTPEGMAEAVHAVLARQIEQSTTVIAGRPDGIDTRRTAVFLAGGVLALLVDWLREPDPQPIDTLVEEILALIPDWMTQ